MWRTKSKSALLFDDVHVLMTLSAGRASSCMALAKHSLFESELYQMAGHVTCLTVGLDSYEQIDRNMAIGNIPLNMHTGQ